MRPTDSFLPFWELDDDERTPFDSCRRTMAASFFLLRMMMRMMRPPPFSSSPPEDLGRNYRGLFSVDRCLSPFQSRENFPLPERPGPRDTLFFFLFIREAAVAGAEGFPPLGGEGIAPSLAFFFMRRKASTVSFFSFWKGIVAEVPPFFFCQWVPAAAAASFVFFLSFLVTDRTTDIPALPLLFLPLYE